MKKHRLLILSSLTSLFLASVAYGSLPISLKKNSSNLLITQRLSTETIQQKAKSISVRVETDNSAGSGVIIGQEGNTYTVLTNAHVINSKVSNTIITNDGQSHAAQVISEGNSLEGNDLAVLTFESANTYQVATLAVDPNLEENSTVYSVGFPEETEQFYLSQGNLKQQPPKPFIGGYQIGYDIEVKSGMSGGALLNSKGELIGVNGLLQNPILDSAYTYLDGSQPYEQQIETYRNLSFAVPIQTLVEVAPNLALIPNEWKTGLNLAEKVDNIARQITVRIDSNKGVVGSGVIVGKDGDTYYVFTACHVVSDNECLSREVKNNYTLVTADGEKYSLNANNIILPKGMDAAIIKFNSQKAYKVATIGKYNIPVTRKQLIFVSGFPGELNGVRKFTAGRRFQKDKGLNLSFDNVNLNINLSGYELLYTNLTKPGMSGGPVLDINGQVIGINTGQEGEQVSQTEVRQLGLAFGVPASNLVTFASQKQVNLNHFKISQQSPKKISDRDWKIVKQHPTFVIETPPKDSNENTWLNYGSELFRLERDEEAIIAYQKAIEINPNFAEAYYGLGFVYDQIMLNKSKNTDNKDIGKEEALKAIEAFDKVVELRASWHLTGLALFKKSQILQKLEQYEEALVAIERSIELMNDENEDKSQSRLYFQTYDQRGDILEALGRYSEAKEAYDKSIEIYPSGFSYFGRGYLLTMKLNKHQEAIKDFDKAIESGMIFAYGVRAIAYFKLNDDEAGLADLNKSLEFQPEQASTYGLRGIIYGRMKDYSQALVDQTKAIELEPNNANFYNGRHYIYWKMGNIPQALTDLTKAIELDPENDDYYFQRNTIYFLNGQYKLALEDIRQAIKLNPKEAKYYEQSGQLKYSLGDNQGALEDYNEAIKVDENYAKAYQTRGSFYITTFQDYSKAIADFTKAIEINPKFGSAYNKRGSLRQQLSDFQGALEDYNQAILLIKDPDPIIHLLWNGGTLEDAKNLNQQLFSDLADNKSSVYAGVYRNRGNLRLKLKDTEGALQDYNEAIKLAPKDGEFYVIRGDYYTQTQQPEKAQADYNQAIKLYSETLKNNKKNLSALLAYQGRAEVYSKLKNYVAAIADYSQAINIQAPDLYLRYMYRAEVYKQIKDYEAAIKDYSQAIELQPQYILSYVERASIYSEMKNYDAAIKDFSQVIKLDEKANNPLVTFTYLERGKLYQQSKNNPEAIKDFSTFIKLQPENYQGYTYRCLVYTDLKDYNQAMNDCNQALKIAPNNPEVYFASAALNGRLKNYSEALKDANKIIELVPNMPIGYWLRGVMYWAQNNPTKALSDYELALSKNDKFAPAISSIGSIKYEQGDKQKAIELWQKAINLQEDLADTKLALAAVLYHQGQPERALSLAKEAINMDQRLEDINHLQDNLWGEQLIEDTKPLLNQVK